MFKRRGTSWSYVVDVGEDPTTAKRKQQTSGGFATKKDAEAALREVLSFPFGKDRLSCVETFAEAFDDFGGIRPPEGGADELWAAKVEEVADAHGVPG